MFPADLQAENGGNELFGRWRGVGEGIGRGESHSRRTILGIFTETLKGSQALGVPFRVRQMRLEVLKGWIGQCYRIDLPAVQFHCQSFAVTGRPTEDPEPGSGFDGLGKKGCQKGVGGSFHRAQRERMDVLGIRQKLFEGTVVPGEIQGFRRGINCWN